MHHHDLRTIEHAEFVIRERAYAPGVRMPRHAHEYSNVTVVINGEIEEDAEQGRYRGRSCSVVLKPAGAEHENRVSGRGVRTLTIELKSGRVADELATRRWSWFEQPEVVRAAVALCRTGDESNAWALLATVLAVPTPDSASPAWLRGVLDAVEERFDVPLGLEALARDFGLHPVYLSRAFHRHMRIPLAEYHRALRIRHARHLLATSKRSLTAIAGESGFFDSSHLSRTFANMLDVTPKNYRRLCAEVQRVQIPRSVRS